MSHQEAIRSLQEKGWSQRRIARELGIHRKTVWRYTRGQPKCTTISTFRTLDMPQSNRPQPAVKWSRFRPQRWYILIRPRVVHFDRPLTVVLLKCLPKPGLHPPTKVDTVRLIPMCNDISFNAPGVAQIRVGGNWLAGNGRLPVCIGKPPRRVEEIANDAVSADLLPFARAILERNGNGSSQLQGWFAGEAGLLLFPEYAFSSQDYAGIDACVRQHPTPLIVLAGFGAVLGSDLAALLHNGCLAAWPNGAAALAAQGRYNAGWCWIHESPGHTRCVVFVKNYPDQTAEIAEVPNLLTLGAILRIETDDLVIYPLICSDLISQQPNAPRTRIAQLLALPANGKRAAICTISCNSSPQSGWWRTAIDDVVQMQQQQTVLIFANQTVTMPQPDEDNDRWRCLSGAFISRTRMPHPPRAPLPSVRHVATEAAASGLILRHPEAGAAVGLVGWDLTQAIGLFVWEPRMRLVWTNGHFEALNDAVNVYETRRYVERRSAAMVAQFAQATRPPILATLGSIVSQPDETLVNPRLWPELLDGLGAGKSHRSADTLYLDQDELDSAFGMFAAVQAATNGQPVVGGRQRGQLHWEAKDIRVWRSPILREDQMLRECGKLSLEGGSAPPLIVIGRGLAFGVAVPAQPAASPAQQTVPERQTDITNPIAPHGGASDIESTRLRRVFWQPMGKLEQVLVHAPADFAPALRAAITDQLNID